jgi:hypothetical protein
MVGEMSASPLISFKEAGELLGGLHPNTLRERKAGTADLTHVAFGRRVFLIRQEVEDLLYQRINQARSVEKKRRNSFRVVRGSL